MLAPADPATQALVDPHTTAQAAPHIAAPVGRVMQVQVDPNTEDLEAPPTPDRVVLATMALEAPRTTDRAGLRTMAQAGRATQVRAGRAIPDLAAQAQGAPLFAGSSSPIPMDLKDILSVVFVGAIWLFLVVQVPFFAHMSVFFGALLVVMGLVESRPVGAFMLLIGVGMVVGALLVINSRGAKRRE